MNVRLSNLSMTLLASVTLLASTSALGGATATKLEQAGYACFNAGPSNWIHCLRPGKFGFPSVPVKVFSEDGNEFLGTEQLLRYDVYKGQPCPQDELDEWDYLGDPPYYACHHFHTGHH